MKETLYINDPEIAINNYLQGITTTTSQVIFERASDIINSNFHRKDSFGIIVDMARDQYLVIEPTPVLAKMFDRRDENLPPEWRKNPEVWRHVLSISAHIDLGYAQAQLLRSQNNDGDASMLNKKIEGLQKLISTLQEKESSTTGEGGEANKERQF